MSEIRRTGGGPSGVPQTDSTAPVPGDSPSTKDSPAVQETSGGTPKPDPQIAADKIFELGISTVAKMLDSALDGGPLRDKRMERAGGTPLESAPQILKAADELVKKAAEEVAKLPGGLKMVGDPH